MALQSQFTIWAYNLANPTAKQDITPYITDITFDTAAQGGYGTLTARMVTKNARLLPPELFLFSNVAVMAGPFPCFLGRWDEPGSVIGDGTSDGDTFELTAQGAATCLADDAQDTSYSAQTAAQIVTNQYTVGSPSRSYYLLIDSDTSQIFPNGVVSTYNKAYTGKSFADVLADVIGTEGDYSYQVWGHGRNRDAAGFPTWQLFIHPRDTTTTSFMALHEDITNVDVRPSVEYSYNVVTLNYKDSTTLLPATITVADSRLTANYAQGSAPFPMRRLRKDLTTTQLSSSEASSLANAYLTQYQNGGFKITVDLAFVRDATGTPIPLWRVRGDGNIYLPDLAPITATLPFAVSANVNQFYVQTTNYQEQNGQTPTLEIVCNSFSDEAAFQLAKLQYNSDLATQNLKSQAIVTQPGQPEKGFCGGSLQASGASQSVQVGVNFKTVLSSTPSSVTLTSVSSTNVSGVTYGNLAPTGFTLTITSTAAGFTSWQGSYLVSA